MCGKGTSYDQFAVALCRSGLFNQHRRHWVLYPADDSSLARRLDEDKQAATMEAPCAQ
jgi:hypothetical protein